MNVQEKIKDLKETLVGVEDREIINFINNQIKSLETEERVNNGYRHVIDKVIGLIQNSDIENKVMLSNRLIELIIILKELNTMNGSNLITSLQHTFREIPDEDSKEIMTHVYTNFFTENIKKKNKLNLVT